jgi:phosphotransferase system enzyme I (PtsI)
MTVDAAQANGISVAVCGEMSGDPMALLLFLGMEMDELSMVPSFIPSIKSIVRSSKFEDAKKLLDNVLECSSASEVKTLVNKELKKIYSTSRKGR